MGSGRELPPGGRGATSVLNDAVSVIDEVRRRVWGDSGSGAPDAADMAHLVGMWAALTVAEGDVAGNADPESLMDGLLSGWRFGATAVEVAGGPELRGYGGDPDVAVAAGTDGDSDDGEMDDGDASAAASSALDGNARAVRDVARAAVSASSGTWVADPGGEGGDPNAAFLPLERPDGEEHLVAVGVDGMEDVDPAAVSLLGGAWSEVVRLVEPDLREACAGLVGRPVSEGEASAGRVAAVMLKAAEAEMNMQPPGVAGAEAAAIRLARELSDLGRVIQRSEGHGST